MTRPKIRYASVCDPYIMIIREDDTLGLYVGEVERGKIRRKDMTPMGEKADISFPWVVPIILIHDLQTSRYTAGCFFSDTSATFQNRSTAEQAANGTEKNAHATVESVVNSDTRSQWLLLVRPQGVMEACPVNLSQIPKILHARADLDASQTDLGFLYRVCGDVTSDYHRLLCWPSLVSSGRSTKTD